MRPSSKSTRVVLTILLAWLLLALALGASPLMQRLQPPAPQILLFALTFAVLGLLFYVGPIRAWATAADVRWFVAFHLTRFVGIYFLLLYERGELPYAFAVLGGWGDIVVAVLALLLLVIGPPAGGRRGLYLAWNVVGLADILFVVMTAARLGLADADSMAALLRLPLSLLPTFVVPLIIASHIWLFKRLLGDRRKAEAA